MPLTARLSRPGLLLALALTAAGCAASESVTPEIAYDGCGIPRRSDCDTTAGISAGDVRVTPTASGLSVENQTERPVYLFAVNAETLALLDWVPCTTAPSCPALAQGARRDIPWADVYLYGPNVKQYTVYWWNVVTLSDGSLRADNLHNMTVSR